MAARWPFVGRTGELARIDSLIAAGTGVLILGEPGAGKTALARRAEELIAPRAPVGHVIGHAVSNGAPFEAFAGVLTAADSSVLTTVEVAGRVAERLAQPAGTKALFVVDDAQLLDERSAQVLLQLAADGVVTVLATARDLELPAGVRRLWRDGRCERIELAALAEDEVLELLETVLGAPVDSAAARAFAGRSQGNPLLLRELVSAALDASTLVWRGTAWTLAGEAADQQRGSRAGPVQVGGAARRSTLGPGNWWRPVTAGAVDRRGIDRRDRAGRARRRPADLGARPGWPGRRSAACTRCTARCCAPTCHRCGCAGCGCRWPASWRRCERPSPHDLVRAALWRLDSGQTDEPERLLAAARAARTLSLDTAERWPGTRTRPAARCRPPCCSPRSSPMPAAARRPAS